MLHPQVSPGTVHEFIRGLTNTVDPEVLLEKIGRQFQELFGPDLVLIFQVTSPPGDFTPLYSHGFDRKLLDGLSFSGHNSLSEWLARNRTCIDLTRQLGLLDQLDEVERELLKRLSTKICVPLISLNHLVGVILLGARDPSWQLEHEEIELLETLSAQAALALENAILLSHQKDRLRHLLLADRLTAVGQIAAGIAHEIRNPLAAISSTLQYVLRDLVNDPPKRTLVEGLLSEVERINRTVEQLLDLARIREFQPRAQGLLESLEQALLLVEGQARRQGVEIARSYGVEPFMVLGDEDGLKQLFLNVFLNALQAMETGGTLHIRVDRWKPSLFSSAEPRVEIEIEDTGCGIPESASERLFEPFFTTKPQGTGLGLAICQSIAERHGGEIEIQGGPGAGTAVRIRLPLMD